MDSTERVCDIQYVEISNMYCPCSFSVVIICLFQILLNMLCLLQGVTECQSALILMLYYAVWSKNLDVKNWW